MTPREWYIVARNTVRVMADSTRLDDILETGNIVTRRRMTETARELHQSPEGNRLLVERPELSSAEVDFDALRALPEGSLGRVYIDHMDRYGLDADALNKPAPRPSDPEPLYLIRRFRGNHDIWHALLGLGTEGYEEVLVHAFSYGQLRLPISTMVVLFGTLKHIIAERRWATLRHGLIEAYRAGRQAEPLIAVRWEQEWDQPIGEVRSRYRVYPLSGGDR